MNGRVMGGILIWCSDNDSSALIWCEDSEGLAVVSGPSAWRNPMMPCAVGDYVRFETAAGNDLRLARDIHVVETNVAPQLPSDLINSTTVAPKKRKCSAKKMLAQKRKKSGSNIFVFNAS